LKKQKKNKATVEDALSVTQSDVSNMKIELENTIATRQKIEELNKELDREIADLKDRLSVTDKERYGSIEEKKVLDDKLQEWKDKLNYTIRQAENLDKQGRQLEKDISAAREKALSSSVGSNSEKLLRLEADNRRLSERIDEEADKIIVLEGEKKEFQANVANLRSQSHKLEDELILLKEQLQKEQKATQDLKIRLEGFFVTLGKKT